MAPVHSGPVRLSRTDHLESQDNSFCLSGSRLIDFRRVCISATVREARVIAGDWDRLLSDFESKQGGGCR